MSERYVVLDESKSGHCCFSHSVIDTEAEHKYGASDVICETFIRADANKVAEALNRMEALKGGR